MHKIILLLILLFSICSSKQLYMASVFRHGARYPLNDMYDGKQTKPLHGQLTSVGLREQYLLGSYIQSDYIAKGKLLQNKLNPRQLEVFALKAERCKESAYGHVLGLFPFMQGQTINASIDPALLEPPFETIFLNNLKSEQAPSNFALANGYQPVPIRDGDNFFPDCANANNIFIKRGQEILIKLEELEAEFLVFTQQMKKMFNLTLAQTQIGGLAQLYDTIICDYYLGRAMPAKFKDSDFEKLSYIQRYLFTIVFQEAPARIFNAPFVNEMLGNMQNIINGKMSVKKMSLYSAHDSNVLPLLVFYNLTSSDCLKRLYKNETVKGNCAVPIPFASNLLFELHQNDQTSEYFVKMRFNGIYYNLCDKNSTQCQFKEYSRKSRNYLLDFDKQCVKPKSVFNKVAQTIMSYM